MANGKFQAMANTLASKPIIDPTGMSQRKDGGPTPNAKPAPRKIGLPASSKPPQNFGGGPTTNTKQPPTIKK